MDTNQHQCGFTAEALRRGEMPLQTESLAGIGDRCLVAQRRGGGACDNPFHLGQRAFFPAWPDAKRWNWLLLLSLPQRFRKNDETWSPPWQGLGWTWTLVVLFFFVGQVGSAAPATLAGHLTANFAARVIDAHRHGLVVLYDIAGVRNVPPVSRHKTAPVLEHANPLR